MDTPDKRLAEWFIFYIAGLLFFTVGAITTLGLDWYRTIVVPAWAPSISLTVIIWCVVFIGMALSAAQAWSKGFHTRLGWYGLNVILLLVWNYLFFGAHSFGPALTLAVLVFLSLLQLLILNWRNARKAVWLLLPYLAWMLYALPLTYLIYQFN